MVIGYKPAVGQIYRAHRRCIGPKRSDGENGKNATHENEPAPRGKNLYL